MKMLQNAVAEIVGLFIDDWLFAALIVGWIALFHFAGQRLSAGMAAPLLFLGFALLVLAFVVKRARANQ